MKNDLTVAVFAADLWEHVCPVVRVTGPAQMGGIQILQGNRWENGTLLNTPEVVEKADLVLVQRNFPAHLDAFAQVVELAQAHNKPLVYELDDLLTELPPEHPDIAYYRKTRPAILSAIALADAVVGSTPTICAYLKNWNERVFHFPNYLNDTLWPLTPPRPTPEPKERLVLGYMGGHSHLADLEILTPVLERLMRKYWGYLTLRFWGVPPPAPLRTWADVEHHIPELVSYARFAEYFSQQSADFFIAPLQDNLFNRAKSHLKFLEYSGMGIPGVYSRLPTYTRIVVDGENGFLADSEETWEVRLTELIEQSETRARLGQAAYQTVSEHWRLSQHRDEWGATLQRIVEAGPKAHPARVWQITHQTNQWYEEVENLIAVREKTLAVSQAQLAQSQAQLAQSQAQLAQSQAELTIERDERARLEGELTELQAKIKYEANRKGTKLLEQLRALPIRLFPYKSLRWRGWMILLNVVYNFRAGGWKGVILNASNLDPKPHLPHLELTLGEGQPCPSPAFTVICLAAHFTPFFDESHIQAWVQHQTMPGQVTVVTWDERTGQACLAKGTCWQADDVPALLNKLPGRYVCVASPDLLEQPNTYLEGNLLALETEALDFTVNLNGAAEWAYPHLQKGHLPGDATMPLARIIARKEIVTPTWTLNPRLDHPTPSADRVIGRIIAHTRSATAGDTALPFGTLLHGHVHVFEKRLILRPDPVTEFTGVPLTIRPVTQMLAPEPVSDERPTVLVLISFLAVGGAEFLLYNILRKLQPQFRFVIMTVEGMLPSQGTTTDLFRSITPYVYISPDYLEMKLNFSMLEYLYTRFSPVTIYIPNGSNWLFDHIEQLRARFAEVRFINQVYDHAVGWIFRYNETFAQAVDIHIAPNQNIAQAYAERGARMEQIAFIEHGISSEELDPQTYDAEKIATLKTQLNLPLDKKIIAFVARLYPQKRPMDFVELARRFQNDPHVYFLMVGDGVLREKVDAQIARSHLQNFRRLDFYKPIKDIYALLDVLVLPSKYEAMPMVVAETLAMGKPVVVTDVGNNRDVVEMTGGGEVVSAIGNVAALQVAVQKVLANPPDPEKLRATILARFDIQWIAEKHAQIFLPK